VPRCSVSSASSAVSSTFLVSWFSSPPGPTRLTPWENADKNIWRYILKAVDGGTVVTEEWDARKSPRPFFMRLMRFPARNAAGIERTLANLETRMTTSV
jgi:hypothetical protein